MSMVARRRNKSHKIINSLSRHQFDQAPKSVLILSNIENWVFSAPLL